MPSRLKIIQPKALELAYYREIMGVLHEQDTLFKRYVNLLPNQGERLDDWSSDLDRFFRAVQAGVSAAIDRARVAKAFTDTSLFNWRMWGRQVREGTDFELPKTNPWGEPGIDELGKEWIQDNIRRIKGFTDERNGGLRKAITDAIQRGASREELAALILRKGYLNNLSSTRLSDAQRADLIATDQILTANADLTTQRMRNAKVKYYIWRGMDDSRERPEHVQLNDSVFRVDGKIMTERDLKAVGKQGQIMRTPGAEIAPGRAIRCRCYAEAIFDGSDYDMAG